MACSDDAWVRRMDIVSDAEKIPVQPPAPSRRRGAKGEARREAIMDAAEAVFSERGYYGASMREISARGGAALGLINHYFPSKEALVQAVVDRRLPVLRDAVAEGLAEAGDDPREIVKAFLTPFLRACVDDYRGLRSYIRMTSMFMSHYRVPEVTPALASLKAVSDLFADRLRIGLPGLNQQQFEIGLYLTESALVFIVQDAGFLDSISAGHFDADRIDQLLDPAATFFTAGNLALADPT